MIDKEGRYFIEFWKKSFEYNADKKLFESIKYPEGETLSVYHKSQGLKKMNIEESWLYFGDNKLDIPIPNFIDLMKEHFVAPLFVF